MDYESARLHNLLIRVYKATTKKSNYLDVNEDLSKEALHSLFFRESDFRIINNQNKYFSHIGSSYTLSIMAKTKIVQYSINHRQFKELDLKDEFISKFESLQNESMLEQSEEGRIFNELIGLAEKLHWKFQPEYEEYMLVNSGRFPEDDLTKYYDHYHTLEDLYWVLTGSSKKKKIKSYLGDINLNKQFDFNVFSKRWGHYDRYKVCRTLDGWDVDFLMTGGTGDKEGSAIIRCLEHDLISYPHNIKSYFRDVWEYADKNTVAVDKLAKKMNKLAEWISYSEIKKPQLKLGDI